MKLGEHGLYLRTTAMRPIGFGGRRRSGLCRGYGGTANCSRHVLRSSGGTTGAGDCTIAGFLAGLLKGLGPESALRGAVAVGACNVEQADATSGVPSWEAVQARIAAGWSKRRRRLHFRAGRKPKGYGEDRKNAARSAE